MTPETISAGFECLLEAGPGAGALGLLARQARFAGAVLDRVEGDFDIIAGLDLDLAFLGSELVDGNDGLGLEADVDDHEILADFDHVTHQDGAGLDALAGDTLFEKLGKTLGHKFWG